MNLKRRRGGGEDDDDDDDDGYDCDDDLNDMNDDDDDDDDISKLAVDYMRIDDHGSRKRFKKCCDVEEAVQGIQAIHLAPQTLTPPLTPTTIITAATHPFTTMTASSAPFTTSGSTTLSTSNTTTSTTTAAAAAHTHSTFPFFTFPKQVKSFSLKEDWERESSSDDPRRCVVDDVSLSEALIKAADTHPFLARMLKNR